MIDAYTIGITLALNNGVSDGIAVIRQDLQALDRAVEASSLGLVHLRQIADASVAAATADIARLMEATRQAAALLPRLAVGPAPEGGGHEQPPLPRREPAPQVIPAVAAQWQPDDPPAPDTASPSASSPAVPPGPSLPSPRDNAVPSAMQTSQPPPPTAPRQPSEAAQAPPPRVPPLPPLRQPMEAFVPPPVPPQAPQIPQGRSPGSQEIAVATQPAAPSAPADRAIGRTLAPSVERDPGPWNDPKQAGADAPREPPSIDYASVARILSPLAQTSAKTAETAQPESPEASWSSASSGERPVVEFPSALPPVVSTRRPAATQPETDETQASRSSPAERSSDATGARTQPAVLPNLSLPQMASPRSAPPKPNTPILSTGLPSAARQQTRADPMPTTVEVILDGASIGRWMDQRMAKASSRPPSGSTSFDPRVTPVWTTVPVSN